MKSIKISIVTVFAGCFLTLSAFAQEKKATVTDLNFIGGCWEINKPERKMLVSEQWMSPAGDAMIGMSRTVRDGKLAGFEYLRIVQTAEGINYISKPSENSSETAFKLIKWSTNEAVFENATHDFPQRIIYRLKSADSLDARIEGMMNGKLRGIDFAFMRTKCG